jgi:pseudouridine synthase
MIQEGRVAVDGHIVRAPWTQVDPRTAQIAVDGHLLEVEAPVYLMLHKPSGVLTAASDPFGRRTVLDLIDLPHRVFPIGRLDYDTDGLLLLTNDGDLAYRLMHPSYSVPKTYLAQVSGLPDERALAELARGPVLEDGPTQPAAVRLIRAARNEATLEITVTEGKKRQVRRMCKRVGHPVLTLTRVRYDGVSLGRLGTGRWRRLTSAEVDSLRRAAGIATREKARGRRREVEPVSARRRAR